MNLSRQQIFGLLLVVCMITLLPFLGLADFHTKGEPREAIVAYSILESGNWILPTNTGGEMPYKPPFFHWLVAGASWLSGGEVSEYASRLPSALALIVMTVWTFAFVARRRSNGEGLCTALVLLTAFEIHRAGLNCRVDMVLTMLTVGAIYAFYGWWQRGMRGISWFASLLMGLATLTKGPVGMLVPCLVAGVFLLFERVNFFRALWKIALPGLFSLAIPALWYWAAYQQGGQAFLDLVMEENFGRMTSTMAYDSCVHAWPYNIMTLTVGMLPWTLLAIAGVFGIFASEKRGRVPGRIDEMMMRRAAVDRSLLKLAAVASVVIFVFYCFPQSKRSVYLMPMYPFVAYLFVSYMRYIGQRAPGIVRGFAWFMAVLAVIAPIAFVALKCGLVPDSVAGHGRHAAQNLAMMKAVADCGLWWQWILVMLPAVVAALWIFGSDRRCGPLESIGWSAALVIAIYVSVDGVYQPAVLNTKSQKDVAATIAAEFPPEKGALYEFIEAGETAKGDPVHYFELNFYLGDRVSSFVKQQPAEGYLIAGDEDMTRNRAKFEAEGYQFTPALDTRREIGRQNTRVWRFTRQSAH